MADFSAQRGRSAFGMVIHYMETLFGVHYICCITSDNIITNLLIEIELRRLLRLIGFIYLVGYIDFFCLIGYINLIKRKRYWQS